MRLTVCGYVPPLSFNNGTSRVFLENLQKFSPTNDLLLFCDPSQDELFTGMHQFKVGVDEFARANRELFRTPDRLINQWGVNNLIWSNVMRLTIDKGYTHCIYIESDCRFGQRGWDAVMFNEFFSSPSPLIAAGTLVCYNPHGGGMKALQRWESFIVANNKKKNFPVATYGFGQACKDGTSIFPNGALGVYDLTWIKKWFDLTDVPAICKMKAWDFALGEKVWQDFGLDSYDVVGMLRSVYSGYGETVTTEEQRLQMLREKQIIACHQVKSLASV